MVVTVGLTVGDVPAMMVVKAASEYQVKEPVAQAVADNTELAPSHIAEGLTARPVGLEGVVVTVMVMLPPEGLLQVPNDVVLTQAP